MSSFPSSSSLPIYDVFLSHCGDDKWDIAKPLVDMLRKHRISVFFDADSIIPGSGHEGMNHAMQTARVGIFILSPVFLARTAPVRELITFYRRVKRDSYDDPVPTLVPIFYKLSVHDCREGRIVETLPDGSDEKGFTNRINSPQYKKEVRDSLHYLSKRWGFENLENASNDHSPVALGNTRRFLSRIAGDLLEKLFGKRIPQELIYSIDTDKEQVNMAPQPEDFILLDFEGDTPEKRLKDVVIDYGNDITAIGVTGARSSTRVRTSNQTIRTSGIQGAGGVGKTQTVLSLAHLPEVTSRFPGGIFFARLGAEANKSNVISSISRFLKKIDRREAAAEVRRMDDIDGAIEEAREYFNSRICLFVIDDVWVVNDITVEIVRQLSQLAYNIHSKILYTTRDVHLGGAGAIVFKKLPEETARKILLKTSGFHTEPNTPSSLSSFYSILRSCDGLPLALTLAGGAVRSLCETTYSDNRHKAWDEYADNRHEQAQYTMRDRVLMTINVLSRNMPYRIVDYRNIFACMSILRYSEEIPDSVLSRVWGMKQSLCKQTINELNKFFVVRVRPVNDQGRVTVSLHDYVLDVARQLAEEMNGFSKKINRRLIASYITRRSGLDDPNMVICEEESIKSALFAFRNCWLMLDDDGYIIENSTRVMAAAGMFADVLWLVNRVQWIAKQYKKNGFYQTREDLRIALGYIDKWDGGNIAEKPEIRMNVRDVIGKGVSFLQSMVYQYSKYGLYRSSGNSEIGSSAANKSQESEKAAMKQWVRMKFLALNESIVHINESRWDGMLWSQLYGRLQYFEDKADYVREFLREAVELSPRPWLKPLKGVLPPPSSVDSCFKVSTRYLCHFDNHENGEMVTLSFEHEHSTRSGYIIYERYSYRDGATISCDEIISYEHDTLVPASATFQNNIIYYIISSWVLTVA